VDGIIILKNTTQKISVGVDRGVKWLRIEGSHRYCKYINCSPITTEGEKRIGHVSDPQFLCAMDQLFPQLTTAGF
jgi:hypothetical protein